mmetsp:Transcript_27418/g.45709  ORF Transcript_27418/g.45709 Transcript_27418/m.45709 type:complete len:88 (-) Transcript_27418:299-562(-)
MQGTKKRQACFMNARMDGNCRRSSFRQPNRWLRPHPPSPLTLRCSFVSLYNERDTKLYQAKTHLIEHIAWASTIRAIQEAAISSQIA